MKRLFGRPSPAMVIATVALLAALGGTAVGASVLSKKKVKKIVNSQITKRAPGLSVGSAQSAQPTAFAQVSAAGAVNPANSKNGGSVSLTHTSFYCFSGLPFSPRGLQANLDFYEAPNGNLRLGLGDANGFCPAGTQAFVETFSNSGASTPAGFFVAFYR